MTKRWGTLLILLAVFASSGAILYKYARRDASPQIFSLPPALPEPQPFSPTPSLPQSESPEKAPEKFLLQVPFTAQAPTGNWDEMHNEACEEASALMAAAYFAGDTREELPPSEVEKQLADLTGWEEKRFGYSLDTTAEETAEMIRSVYHLSTALVEDFTQNDVRDALLAKKVVIVPVNGQAIGNPYYRQPGPIYHMLVIRGYTQAGLIANDPGTKRGKNYPYAFTTIKKAGADWNHATATIDTGRSVMIVVSK